MKRITRRVRPSSERVLLTKYRAIATIDANGHVTITSRNGRDLVERFATLASIADGLTEGPMVVDGEIVAFRRRR